MSTTAVTSEAPAVSTERTEPRNSTDNSTFLPTGEHYRLTGEREPSPSVKEDASAAFTKENDSDNGNDSENEKEEQKDSSVKDDDASAASASDTRAASEAADTQKKDKGPAESKTAHTSETRWQKRERELKEARAEIARLKAQAPSQTQTETRSDTKQAPQPATDAKAKGRTEPQIEDIDEKTGKAKYATLKDYLNDHSKWNREEAVREFQEMSEKTERERRQQQTEEIIQKTVNARVEAARKSYSDYDDAVTSALAAKDAEGRDAFFFTKGSPIDGFFLDSERGNDVMYAIAKNFEAHKHIFARDAKGNYLLNPVRQLRELAKIENSLDSAAKTDKSQAASSAKPVTQAHRPPNQVSGKGTVTKDAVDRALEEGDQDAYRREMNSKDPRYQAAVAALKGK